MTSATLTITCPSGPRPLIEEHRHFAVEGTISHEGPLPKELTLLVQVLDRQGNVLRHASTTTENDRRLFTATSLFTGYPKGMDDDRSKLKDYGYPPLLVTDLADPQASLRDATIKCWHDENIFKSIIITATDPAHGLLLDDHMRYTDEEGKPYTALTKGDYKIRVTLWRKDKSLLAMAEKPIRIGSYADVAINRFNPPAHRARMNLWCKKHGIHVLNDLVPGYLNPYLGPWFYHMGLLAMYLASDVTQYVDSHVHLFVYLMDAHSTSYSTELAFLETRGHIEDAKKLTVYHYDIGEAFLGEKKGRILRFKEGRFLWVYRIDLVNSLGKENLFDLNGKSVVRTMTDKRHLKVRAQHPFAVTGCVRPWQFDPKDLVLQADNSYRWDNEISLIHYRFSNGTRSWECQRPLGMQRIDQKPIGGSKLEFYHLFTLPESERGKTVTITLIAVDAKGKSHPKADARLVLQVV